MSPREDAPRITTSFGSNREFSLYEISFLWFKPLGIAFVLLIGIPLSYIFKRDPNEIHNPQLYASVVRRFMKFESTGYEEVTLQEEEKYQPAEAKILISEEDLKKNIYTYNS